MMNVLSSAMRPRVGLCCARAARREILCAPPRALLKRTHGRVLPAHHAQPGEFFKVGERLLLPLVGVALRVLARA